MGKVIELSDEQYQCVEQLATSRGQTPAALIGDLIAELSAHADDSRSYDTEDWFRHLGATEGQIAEAGQIALRRRSGPDAHS